mmetsp:Transcript_16220/g.39829  ORF Transcript_16220/g.39829 Transcript_16220/m.39829 type:complete len:97 (-) Transcript_16220:172-462(-)
MPPRKRPARAREDPEKLTVVTRRARLSEPPGGTASSGAGPSDTACNRVGVQTDEDEVVLPPGPTDVVRAEDDLQEFAPDNGFESDTSWTPSGVETG